MTPNTRSSRGTVGVIRYAISRAAAAINLVTFPLADFCGGRVWNQPAKIDLDQLHLRSLFPYPAAYPKTLWSAIGAHDDGECSRLGIIDWEF